MGGRGLGFLGVLLAVGVSWGWQGCRFDPVAQVGASGGICGNGVKEGDEDCDGADFGGRSCEDLGYEAGTLACRDTCALDKSGCRTSNAFCGNHLVEQGEDCDGTDLNGETCRGLGFVGGALACTRDCHWDDSGCTHCGDGQVQTGEDCDGSNLGGQDCMSLGYETGDLSCRDNCTFDRSGCHSANPVCGNGLVEGTEDCDGTDLNGRRCQDEGFDGGTLACKSDCTFDTTACSTCGNGLVEASEECDGSDWNGASCSSFGFESGSLSCSDDCSFDLSSCYTCGNGTVEGPEDCDGTNLAGHSCSGEGFAGGDLSCNSDCSLNTDACTNCGNGTVDPGEDCDGRNLNGSSCADQGFALGDLHCSADCSFDVSGCSTCGNGVREGTEECDGSDLDSQTCRSLGYAGGMLDCQNDCTFDESNCVHDGVVGSACTSNTDCIPGFCLREQDSGLPHGYCSMPCTSAFPAACPDGTGCRADQNDNGICLATCHATSDCRPAYSCFGGYCYPDCDSDSDCAGGNCNEWTGYCGESVSGGDIGEPCTSGADCKGRVCFVEDSQSGVPNNGYCTARCALSKGFCPGDAKCSDSGRGYDLGWCLDGCQTNGDCRTGESYICGDLGGVSGVCFDPN